MLKFEYLSGIISDQLRNAFFLGMVPQIICAETTRRKVNTLNHYSTGPTESLGLVSLAVGLGDIVAALDN